MDRSTGANTIEVYNVRQTLEFAKPKLVYSQFGAPDLVLRRKGQTATWLKFDKLAIPSSVLGDTPTFTAETVTESTVSATLELWGNGIQLVEALKETSFLDLPMEYKKLLGQNAGETINQKVRDVLITGTSVDYANAKASRSALINNDQIDMDDILASVQALELADAPKIGDNYVAIISPRIKTTLMKETAFREAARYLGKDNTAFTGELVTLDGTKFVVTSTAPSITNSGSNSSVTAVEQTIIVGDGAYGIARLLPGDFNVVITQPGGHGDEYKVKTSMTWKAYMKTVILQQTFMRRLESAR